MTTKKLPVDPKLGPGANSRVYELFRDAAIVTRSLQDRLDGVTASTAELNLLDGVTATTAELNILDGVTATAAELNLLDGVTATTAELNYVDGVTSAIQTQLNDKAPLASPTFTGTVHLPTTEMDNSALSEVKTVTWNSNVSQTVTGSTEISFANGQYQTIVVDNAICAITWTFPAAGVYYLEIYWSGDYTPTVPAASASIKYLGRTTAPTIAAGGTFLTIHYHSNATIQQLIRAENIGAA